MSEAIEAEFQRGNDMIIPLGEALGEGRSLNDVLSNRAIFPSGGREERCADNVLRVECQRTRTERK